MTLQQEKAVGQFERVFDTKLTFATISWCDSTIILQELLARILTASPVPRGLNASLKHLCSEAYLARALPRI